MIIHADMDAFYASVEIRENPSLAQCPVAVGGPSTGRGVISAANYIARTFGVRSAMPTSVALAKCPDLVLLPGRMSLYVDVSKHIHEIFGHYTPQIEPLSLDEAFLDVSASEKLFGSVEKIGRQIKADIKKQLDLVVSIGIAPNKFVAKIASDIDKPDGFVLVRASEMQDFLDPLPISRIWGVGKVTNRVFQQMGISSIKQLRLANRDFLKEHFGKHGDHLWQLANAIDNRPVESTREAKSISHETTFAQDIKDKDVIFSQLMQLTEQVTWRLRENGLKGKTLFIKIRFSDFRTITRSISLPKRSCATTTIWNNVKNLFKKEFPNECPQIRLIGVGISGLVATESTDTEENPIQTDLFANEDHRRQNQNHATEDGKIDGLTDAVNNRFGRLGLTRGVGVKFEKSS